jgi:hypothetical protein
MMRFRRQRRHAIVVLSWLLSMALTCAAADAAPRGFESLSITVVALPDEVPVMGGIVLQITIANPAPEPVMAHSAMLPGEGGLDLFMAPPGGDYGPIGTWDRPLASVLVTPSELLPGFSRTFETMVWWGGWRNTPAQAFFVAPGEYRIKARFSNLDRTFVESAPALVRVVPSAPEDEEAYHVIAERSAQAGYFFLRASAPVGKGVDQLREFIAEFGQSRYAPYARYALAGGLRLSKQAEHRAEAIALLKSLIEDRTWPLRRYALYDLIRGLSQGDVLARADASVYLNQLRSEYPDAERIEELGRSLERARAGAQAP